MDLTFWNGGDKDRPLSAVPPCSCGCDVREGDDRPYLTASNGDGIGFTVRLDPDDIARLRRQLDQVTR